MNELKPCPFCGGEAYTWACDRVIEIGCKACNYHMSFPGLVQSEINTHVPVVYKGNIVSDHEWYDKDAHKRATQKWNRRAEE